jgi:hypothetical protein
MSGLVCGVRIEQAGREHVDPGDEVLIDHLGSFHAEQLPGRFDEAAGQLHEELICDVGDGRSEADLRGCDGDIRIARAT